MERRKIIVTCAALLANAVASTGHASCSFTYEKMVRARFIRCEDAEFYLEASGVRTAYERALEEALARTDPRFHDEVRKRWGNGLPHNYQARVAVVMGG